MSDHRTLLLRLAGPMQSWAVQSRFGLREAGTEPSKSGVLGLVAAALGRSRSADLSDLAALRFGVRVDREGTPLRDFHTAGNAVLTRTYGTSVRNKRAEVKGYFKADGGIESNHPIVSERHYLAYAHFTVGLEGKGEEAHVLLDRIHAALCDPHWPPFLGRRSCPPSLPLTFPREEALLDLPLLKALEQASRRGIKEPSRPRFVIDADNSVDEGRESTRTFAGPDQPIGGRPRAFAGREVVTLSHQMSNADFFDDAQSSVDNSGDTGETNMPRSNSDFFDADLD